MYPLVFHRRKKVIWFVMSKEPLGIVYFCWTIPLKSLFTSSSKHKHQIFCASLQLFCIISMITLSTYLWLTLLCLYSSCSLDQCIGLNHQVIQGIKKTVRTISIARWKQILHFSKMHLAINICSQRPHKNHRQLDSHICSDFLSEDTELGLVISQRAADVS